MKKLLSVISFMNAEKLIINTNLKTIKIGF